MPNCCVECVSHKLRQMCITKKKKTQRRQRCHAEEKLDRKKQRKIITLSLSEMKRPVATTVYTMR